MGIRYVTLVECKHYKSAITREKVQVLYDKIRVVGANKGIIRQKKFNKKGSFFVDKFGNYIEE